MDTEPFEWRSRYRLCQAGFSLLALGLALLCLAEAVQLLDIFGVAPEIARAQSAPAWFWVVEAPIPWTTFLGSLLLIGRWKEPFWQGRAVLLTAMNGFDAYSWTLANADRLGLGVGGGMGRYGWLVHITTMGLSWFELLITASLAAAVCAHLGMQHVHRRFLPAQMICTVGASLWLIYSMTQTNWTVWPPMRTPANPAGVLLILASIALRTLACFQIALLGWTASRECRRYLAAWDRHESADPFNTSPPGDREPVDSSKR